MLKITPAEIITFSKVGNELVGTVDILNIVKYPITYKVKYQIDFKCCLSVAYCKLLSILLLFFVHLIIFDQIKTTSPEKFRVRPSTGILAPGASASISVVLQSGPNVTLLLNKDKFLVMCMEMNDLNASQQDIADIWKVNIILQNKKAKRFTIFFN